MNTIKHTQLQSHVAGHEEVNREQTEVKETSLFYNLGLSKFVAISIKIINTQNVSVPQYIRIFSRVVLCSIEANVSQSSQHAIC